MLLVQTSAWCVEFKTRQGKEICQHVAKRHLGNNLDKSLALRPRASSDIPASLKVAKHEPCMILVSWYLSS